MQDIMIDLETLGTVPGCAILSIGAIAFDAFGVAEEGFYYKIHVEEWDREGFTPEGLWKDQDTIDWWKKQGPEAQKVLTGASRGTTRGALNALGLYISCHPGARVWGNGADFDNPIIAVAAAKVNIEPKSLWKGYNGRCYRTVKNAFKDIKLVRSGTHHNALDDARSQAAHLVDICQKRDWRLA